MPIGRAKHASPQAHDQTNVNMHLTRNPMCHCASWTTWKSCCHVRRWSLLYHPAHPHPTAKHRDPVLLQNTYPSTEAMWDKLGKLLATWYRNHSCTYDWRHVCL